MPAFTYQLTLLTDASFSSNNSTNAQETLSYVPGSTLLGAVASRGYPADDQAAWDTFHSGKLRFGVGLPVEADAMCVPVPKCLYSPKGLKGARLRNAVREHVEASVQPQFEKRNFLTATGGKFELPTRSSLRTKLDNGVADDGKLFALEAIQAGAKFIGRVSADSPELLMCARRALVGPEGNAVEGQIAIGRSRRSELGLAKVEILGEDWLHHGPAKAGQAVFLALSDIALRDQFGVPRLLPQGEDVGLVGWNFDESLSAIRTRRYSPYNGHRRRPSLSREVIEAGSVLVFTGPEGNLADGGKIAARLERGIGEFRAEGLGQLWFEPEALAGAELGPWRTVAAKPTISQTGALKSPLLDWLVAREAAVVKRADMFDRARVLGRRFSSIPRSQWGEISAKFAASPNPAALDTFLAEGVRQHAWRHHRADLVRELTNSGSDAVEFLFLLAQHARHANAEKAR